MTDPDLEFLEPGEAASTIGVTVQTLLAWRQRAVGPSFITLPSGTARYPRAKFEHWLEQQTSHSGELTANPNAEGAA